MECAGRGLAFWTYQSTQEMQASQQHMKTSVLTWNSIYQEYLARSLTDKYGNLSVQMDKIINDANAEIDNLNQKLSAMQVDQDRLKSENTNLVTAFREKSRKHQQTQELYDRLKRKEMTAATQSAAYQSVDEVLGSVVNRHPQDMSSGMPQYPNDASDQGQNQQPQYPRDLGAPEQRNSHNRHGSNGNDGKDGMPPPAARFRAPGQGVPLFGSSQNMMTPSQHRTRLGPPGQATGRVMPVDLRHTNGITPSSSQNRSPSRRQPFGAITGNSINKPSGTGYGMSAGMKIGRQQGNRAARPVGNAGLQGGGRPESRFTHPLAQQQQQQQQQYQENGAYY
ncbi:MAG: hypothetical protein Q9191_000582 [Dirinaria sp. TL-2023a]